MDSSVAPQPSAPANPHSRPQRGTVACICLGLAAITWIVFGQTIGFGFIQFDDPGYVSQNPEISAGITRRGLADAFLQTHMRNWHPLTTISHMIDCQLYGLDARGHHFTNVLLHTLAVVLLFLALRQMTGAMWRSAFAAAIFAVHPLRPESVAWIAERKDVLSAVFFMLTLIAYTRYVGRRSVARYAMVAVALAAGLMSKPMLVTVPVLLLLLDYWPLRRFAMPLRASAGPLLLEKIPLVFLAIASAVATLIAQESTVAYAAQIPFLSRCGNALVSYVAYIWQMLWPERLAAFYPRAEDDLALSHLIFAAALIAALSALGIVLRRRCPYLITGWFWYLLMLLPAIGIVQVGLQARADRYTYLPQIGLGIAIVWAAEAVSRRLVYGRTILATSGAGVVLCLMFCGFIQTSYWRSDEALWEHAAAATRDNDLAEYNYAAFLRQHGQLDEAIAHFRVAIAAQHDARETPAHISAALLHANLAGALADKGSIDEAIAEYETAIDLRPDYADAHINLGNLLAQKGDNNNAATHYRAALMIPPEDAASHLGLGLALLRTGHAAEGKAQLERAVEIAPDAIPPLNGLAWLLGTSSSDTTQDGARAVELAERANMHGGGKDPATWRVLAAAYAAANRFSDAVNAARRGSEIARAIKAEPLAAALEADARLYASGAARRED